MKRAMLGAFLCCFLTQGWAAAPFRENPPSSYTVVKKDTLWDISGRFLANPWDWPKVWQNNPHIADPHKIYPGDVIELIYVGGEPRLQVKRGEGGRTIKLSPKIRSTPIEQAIASIPMEALDAFLTESRIIDSTEVLQQAPYVVSLEGGKVIGGVGDMVYARGEELHSEQRDYGIYRNSKPFRDPQTGELLGLLANSVGVLKKQSMSDHNVATMQVSKSNQEVRIGDRLLPTEEHIITSTFFPSAPKNPDIKGSIIDIVAGVRNVGIYSNVVIGLGAREGLKDGDLLAIYRTGTITDKITGEVLPMPPKRIGLLMVYHVYGKLSLALVMEAKELIQVGDEVRAP